MCGLCIYTTSGITATQRTPTANKNGMRVDFHFSEQFLMDGTRLMDMERMIGGGGGGVRTETERVGGFKCEADFRCDDTLEKDSRASVRVGERVKQRARATGERI